MTAPMHDLTIDLWYGDHQRFGHLGQTQRWVNVLGQVNSPDGIHALAYRLNGGRRIPLSMGPTAFRLLGDGDFNVELDADDLLEGENRIELLAVDLAGKEAARDVTVVLERGKRWAIPCEVNWSDVSIAQDAVQVVDGLWQLNGEGFRVVEPGYDRLAAIGDMAWQDYEVTLPITFHGFDERPVARTWPSTGQAFGMALRWQGHHDWNDMYPRRGYAPVGSIGMIRWNQETGDCRRAIGCTSLVQDDKAIAFEPGDTLAFKMAVRSNENGPATYSLKVWHDGEEEPGSWQVEGGNEGEELNTGSMLLFAHHSDVTYGDVKVREI